jgi:organic radical activating enzyme|tara:strand:+ start:422 stop:1348 length:927 start_codon:yes stop_codon:yes gene_type:complete
MYVKTTLVENTTFVVLTSDNKIKYSHNADLIKNNQVLFLKWHCEVFDHSKTITSQLGITGHTACGNNSRTCNVSICACPTDIHIPKAINSKTLDNFRTLVNNITKYTPLDEYNISDGEIIACGLYGLLLNQRFVVDWNLLRRCNFSCTYCAPDIHDYKSDFPSFEQYQKEFSEIEVPAGKETHFTLNGGEPTLHPNILDIVKMCNGTGTVELLSNGTAPIKMYDNLLDYAKINISIHHELINEKHMQKFVDIALLNKGKLVFKYFNTFDEEKFGKYLNILIKFDHVSIISNKRLILRGNRKNLKTWLT